MKTKVILLVGSNGTVKDILLKYLNDIYAEKINFVKRYITREADTNESNYYIDEYAFEILRHNCYFASTWQAHGNFYGIPKRFIQNGLNIICVSRARIVDFENLYDYVYTININIPKKEMAKTLPRTYEKIEARNLIEFDNTLSLQGTKEKFIEVIRQIENE